MKSMCDEKYQMLNCTSRRREILCFKQMYKMGKKRLEHPVFLYGVLWVGFQAGKLGDKLCYVNQNQDMIQAFEKVRLYMMGWPFQLIFIHILIPNLAWFFLEKLNRIRDADLHYVFEEY